MSKRVAELQRDLDLRDSEIKVLKQRQQRKSAEHEGEVSALHAHIDKLSDANQHLEESLGDSEEAAAIAAAQHATAAVQGAAELQAAQQQTEQLLDRLATSQAEKNEMAMENQEMLREHRALQRDVSQASHTDLTSF